MTRTITLGHSPDPDDAFMFYGLAEGVINTRGFRFTHVLQDIETLNHRALKGELDITAISFHAYPAVRHNYVLLPCGASLGDGYGPIVVRRGNVQTPKTRPRNPKVFLNSCRIAVPGLMTSAFLALQLFLGRKLPPSPGPDQPGYVVVPFDKIFECLRQNQADAGLLIHEGQLTFGLSGFERVIDLGRWWHGATGGLPLPLGANAIHRRFTPGEGRLIAEILLESIRHGLKNRQKALAYARRFGRGLNAKQADRFVGMYVNNLTLDLGVRGRAGIREFFSRAFQAGLIPEPVSPEFAV